MKIKRSDTIDYDALPLELVNLLETMILRTRRIIIFRGSLATIAVAIATTLIMMAIDCTTVIESNTLRWSLTGIGFATIIVAAYKTIYSPLQIEITLTDIARLIEINNPQLEERISSAIELVSEKDGYVNADSKLLISDLVRKARVDINSITPQNELTLKTATPQIIITALMFPIIIAIFSVWPYQATLTFARTLFPSSNLGNIYAENLVVTPGDIEIKSGDSLHITTTTEDLDTERIEFRRIADDGSELIERMMLISTTETSKEFSLEIPSVERSFKYRIMANRALTKYFNVSVFQMPEIKTLSITTISPEYSQIAPYQQKNNEYVKALYGSYLIFTAEFTKPVIADLYVHKRHIGSPQEKASFVNKKEWRVLLTKDFGSALQTWKIMLTDEDGNVSEESEFPIAVTKDTVPSINIMKPTKKVLTLNPSDTFKIEYYAYDDFSITSPTLVVKDKTKVIYLEKLKHPILHKQNIWQGSLDFDLTNIKLNGQKKLFVSIMFKDNFPIKLGPVHKVMSQVIQINIDSQALSLSQQTIKVQQLKIKEVLLGILTTLKPVNVLIHKTVHLPKKDKTPEYIQALFSGSRNELLEVSTKLASLSKQLLPTEFKTIARDIEYVRKDHISSSLQGMELMLLSDPTDYPLYLSEIAKEISAGIKGLKTLLFQIDTLATKIHELAELKLIAKRQIALAKSAQIIESKQQLNSWKSKQNKIIKRLADLLKKNAVERKKDIINDLDTLNRLIALGKSIKDKILNGQEKEVSVRKSAKSLIIDSVTLATKVEYIHQVSEKTKMVKVAAIRLNKRLSLNSLVLLTNALNSMRELINKKAKTLNFDQTNMGTEGMSESLKKAIKARMASNKQQANKLARETVKSIQDITKQLSGGIGLTVAMPQQSSGNANANLEVELGESTAGWARVSGQLGSKVIKSKQDTIPLEYKDLVNKYFEELKKLK